MAPRWLEHAAAFIVLWFVLAIILGVAIAALMGHGGVSVGTRDDKDPQP